FLPLHVTAPSGASLSFSASGLPGDLSIDAATGVIWGTISDTAAETNGGVYTVVVSVTDGNDCASQTFTWTVVNAPLTLGNPGDQDNAEGDDVSLFIGAYGGQGDTYTYSASGLPLGLTLDAQTGEIAGTLAYSAAETNGGTYSIVVTASDGVT